jgi:hypothetical protein
LVVAERLDGQWLETGLFFGEHDGHLAFGGAVNACIGPSLLPVIEIGLGVGQRLKPLALQRRLFGVSDAALHFAFSIRIANTAGHGDGVVVREHIAVERIDFGIVDIGA